VPDTTIAAIAVRVTHATSLLIGRTPLGHGLGFRAWPWHAGPESGLQRQRKIHASYEIVEAPGVGLHLCARLNLVIGGCRLP